MKRRQPIQPAPQATKPPTCRCGVELHVQHTCRWRPPTTSRLTSTSTSAVALHNDPQRAKLPRLETVPAQATGAVPAHGHSRFLITGGLPSARRRPRGLLTPNSALSPSQRQVRLKGMPADVFHPEPFNAYPIPTIGCVHRMVEHYLHVWAPQQGKPFGFEGHPNPYLSLLWPYALQHASIFEGLVAMCRASWLLEHGESTLHDRGFAYHHNNTKYALQKRLESVDTCADDETMLTMLAVTTIDYTLGEHALAEQYLHSMRRMVELRGGTRTNSPWEQFMTSVVTAFDALWTFILTSDPQTGSAAIEASSTPSLPLRNEIPVYANHPFSPEYAATLARIPPGFSNLAVSSLLSVQCVRIIERTPHKPATPPNEPSNPLTSTNGDLHGILTDLLKLTTLSTTKMEYLLCHGLVAYCLPLQYGSPLPISTTRTLQSCVEAYMKLNFAENEEKLDGKCLLWIAVVIAAGLDICADGHLRNAPVLDRILNKFPQARDWSKVEKILHTFLWHEDLASQWYRTWQSVLERRRSPPSGQGLTPVAFSPATMAASSPMPPQSAAGERPGTSGGQPSMSSKEPTSATARSMKVANLLQND